MDEGHDADDNANETSQQGQNHEGPSGIPICCGDKGDEVLRTEYILSMTINKYKFLEVSVNSCSWCMFHFHSSSGSAVA